MSKAHGTRWKHASALLSACAAFTLALALPVTAHADRYPLAPQTKLRVTVVQWIPSKGEYQRWDAVGGEFTVSATGTIALPLVGSMAVADLDGTELAAKIAEQLKNKTGLINIPDATVEILEYPPIYVVGSVASPGEHKFRPGLTVLQAVALSGGRYRPNIENGTKGQLGMLGEWQSLREDILRATGRIARLQAEIAGKKEISFPTELTGGPNKKTGAEIISQERVIFEARTNALQRQLDNLTELRNLFTAEIDVLGKKTEALDNRIKVVGDELTGVKSLVERGIATVSRRSELEFAVANLQSNRLDEVTAVMRARQNLSEATRSALSLRDKHQTDVSTELQDAQANLERARIKEDVLKKTLILSDASPASNERRNENSPDPDLSFSIVRQTPEKAEEIAASESTVLLPGDVVKVAISEPTRRQAAGASTEAVQ
ncbi:polysaccharide biosynthesis/export family protein [Microvirga sp. 2MCAF38]|uniref:polysaccharide biosynthesis/export family protein n=1 Tax=Microvirga sp. 2MCAF38 TaxID=3232989 RepID=UPI003F971F6E